MRAEIIERLMCDFEADVSAICARHGFDAAELIEDNRRLAELEADGVLEIGDGAVRLADSHRFLIRAAAAAFDAYVDQSGRLHGKAA
jgi:oxygen-independent coproporphyrinogen-3 oxidase